MNVWGGFMNINLDLYKVFYHVAKNKNITKAANELNITQPGISKAIKNLEEQLGCSLFIRTKSGVILTDEGKVFYDQIKQAIEIIDNAEDKLNNIDNKQAKVICNLVYYDGTNIIVGEGILKGNIVSPRY